MKLLKIGLTVVSLALAGSAYAVELGDDGLHKTEWMRDTFKDLREDLAEANAEGKRLMLTVEQRGCIYCTKMHQEVFPLPNIDSYLKEHYFVVQINMFGDVEVTDFDGESLPEKDMVRKWGMMFTPTLVFLPEDVAEGQTAAQAAVATVPGAFGPGTTFNMLQWVVDKEYEGDEPFQKYLARKMAE
ncbi:thioredoxin family protein [uncultured Sulfitobacter sp.]|jgi:thioredoxin-related protein|uniref:thioredoxin family protein n=1 Tax=uncultured Sulfitobacter sp. TaxID=191468 RepID=UPI0030D829B9|tara:strand:- start:50396 stop:50953 length:558 start_codon:yes stop_codon:yes gene_type:complete